MALFLLLGSAVFAGNIWAADWGPAGRGPIGVTANFGLGRLSGARASLKVLKSKICAWTQYALAWARRMRTR